MPDIMTKIAFLTDQHISLTQDNPFLIDTKVNFLALWNHVKSQNVDAVFFGGDFCYEKGDKEVYQWFFDHLTTAPFPCYLIPGNHDDSSLMSSVFKGYHVDKESEMYYKKVIRDIPFLFLDTSKGYMGESQWLWLTQEMEKTNDRRMYIVMHHPPVFAGSMHMDSLYAFKETDRFIKLARAHKDKLLTVFSGHYHLDRMVTFENISLYITPSSYINIDPDAPGFAILATQKTGYREMVWKDGLFYTNVVSVF
jgi:3',5'-cyclic-AMP phosphodiesterase